MVGTRWDGKHVLRYMRALSAGSDTPVIVATTRSMPGAAVREPGGEPVVTRSAVDGMDDSMWPEAEFLRQAPGPPSWPAPSGWTSAAGRRWPSPWTERRT